MNMFGFASGESAHVASRKKTRRREAQERWPFLTDFDLSGIRNEDQLVATIIARTGIPEPQARRNVQSWLQVNQS
jgi:hypothetical protein